MGIIPNQLRPLTPAKGMSQWLPDAGIHMVFNFTQGGTAPLKITLLFRFSDFGMIQCAVFSGSFVYAFLVRCGIFSSDGFATYLALVCVSIARRPLHIKRRKAFYLSARWTLLLHYRILLHPLLPYLPCSVFPIIPDLFQPVQSRRFHDAISCGGATFVCYLPFDDHDRADQVLLYPSRLLRSRPEGYAERGRVSGLCRCWVIVTKIVMIVNNKLCYVNFYLEGIKKKL